MTSRANDPNLLFRGFTTPTISFALKEKNTFMQLTLFQLFSYNPGHNTFNLYYILAQVLVATSKAKLDIQYQNFDIQVSHELVKNLRLRIFENQEILENLKIGQRCSLLPSQYFFQEVNFGNNSKKTRKIRYQTFLVPSNFSAFFQLFCLGFSEKTNFSS